MPHIYSLRFGMILDNLFTELRRLENASNKLSVSKFDNPCLNIFVLFGIDTGVSYNFASGI